MSNDSYDRAYNPDAAASAPAAEPDDPADLRARLSEGLALAVKRLGGAEALAKWARRHPANERILWSLAIRRALALELQDKAGTDAGVTEVIAEWLPRE